MVYSEAAKQATYRYRLKVKSTPHFKEKQRAYNVQAWARIKSSPEQLERDRARGRTNYYYADQDKILACVRILFR